MQCSSYETIVGRSRERAVLELALLRGRRVVLGVRFSRRESGCLSGGAHSCGRIRESENPRHDHWSPAGG
jgi:hypothetical protein